MTTLNSMDYNKYSLENLEKWMSDALLSSEATPQEIYDVIHKVVEEEYHYFKHHTGRCYELLALLNGNGKGHLSCDKDDPSPECKKSWTSFWEENYYPEEYEKSKEPKVEDIMPPWGHSDMEALRYTEEELNAMCEKAASDDEKEKCREYNLREAEYYDKRAQLDIEAEKIKVSGGHEWTPDPVVSRNDANRIKYEEGWIYESPDGGKTVTKRKPGSTEKITIKKDRVKSWVLPVQQSVVDGTDDYYVNFPDDLLEAAGLKEGDQVEWVDQKDGSYIIRKVTSPMYHPV
jgi:hypothetical protein